jgi:mRNA interferase HigB
MTNMKLISKRMLREFAERYPDAAIPLEVFRKRIEKRKFMSFAELAGTFPFLDKVGDRYLFNIGGNKYRIAASIAFSVQTIWIKAVMTHAEYDKEKWK